MLIIFFCFHVAELFQTERSHIRVLRVLDQLFYQPIKEQQILPADYLQLLFPNLEEIFVIHSQLNSNLKSRKKENAIVGDVGDILLKTVSKLFFFLQTDFINRIYFLKSESVLHPTLGKLSRGIKNLFCKFLMYVVTNPFIYSFKIFGKLFFHIFWGLFLITRNR